MTKKEKLQKLNKIRSDWERAGYDAVAGVPGAAEKAEKLGRLYVELGGYDDVTADENDNDNAVASVVESVKGAAKKAAKAVSCEMVLTVVLALFFPVSFVIGLLIGDEGVPGVGLGFTLAEAFFVGLVWSINEIYTWRKNHVKE